MQHLNIGIYQMSSCRPVEGLEVTRTHHRNNISVVGTGRRTTADHSALSQGQHIAI